MSAPPRVVLADNHPAMRRSIRAVLERGGFSICAEADSADEAIEAATLQRPAICLVDPRLRGGGVRAIAEIARRREAPAVVALTTARDHETFVDAIRAGAAGYLLTDMDPERLPNALRGVLAGEAAIPRPLMSQLVKAFQTHGRHRVIVGRSGRAELTAREWEVLDLLSQRLAVGEVATRLSVSPVTVRRHLSSAVRKLGVEDRHAAVELLKAAR